MSDLQKPALPAVDRQTATVHTCQLAVNSHDITTNSVTEPEVSEYTKPFRHEALMHRMKDDAANQHWALASRSSVLAGRMRPDSARE